MAGDLISCDFYRPGRWLPSRCRIRTEPETLAYKETTCAGWVESCECKALRERELRRVQVANQRAERASKARMRSAREWAKRRLLLLVERLTARSVAA